MSLTFNVGCKTNGNSSNDQGVLASIFSAGPTGYSISGTTSGYGNLRTDGTADFGLVLKSFSKKNLFNLELNDIMSTQFDTIRVIGSSISLPSNVALPSQKERYIFSIKLDKPEYSLRLNPEDDQKLVLLHGQFPFDDVVSGFRNDQPLLKLADKFDILSYSEYDFSGSPVANKNLDLVAGAKKHSSSVNLSSPQQFDSSYSYLVISLNESNGFYLANNITVIPQNRTKSIKTDSQSSVIFSGLVHENFADSESTSLLRYKMSLKISDTNSLSDDLLGFVENMNYNNGTLQYEAPSEGTMTNLAIAYKIYEIDSQNEEVIFYEGYELNAWNNSIDLSTFETNRRSSARYRLEISLFANKKSKNYVDDQDVINNSTHVSRNSIFL